MKYEKGDDELPIVLHLKPSEFLVIKHRVERGRNKIEMSSLFYTQLVDNLNKAFMIALDDVSETSKEE